MHTGTITKLFYEKEYGSIRSIEGEDIHFHKSGLWGTEFSELKEGQKVELEIQVSYKGFLGFHIRPLGKDSNLQKLDC